MCVCIEVGVYVCICICIYYVCTYIWLDECKRWARIRPALELRPLRSIALTTDALFNTTLVTIP
jgi:hypothetical protein